MIFEFFFFVEENTTEEPPSEPQPTEERKEPKVALNFIHHDYFALKG